ELDLAGAAADGVLEGADGGQQRDRVRPPCWQEAGVVEEHRVTFLQPHLYRDRLIADADGPDPYLALLGENGRRLADEGATARMIEVVAVCNPHARLGPLPVQVEQRRPRGAARAGGRGD